VGRTPVGRTSKFETHLPCEQLSRRPSGPAGSRTRAAGLPNRRHPARPQAHFVSCAVEPRGVEPRCRACEAQPPPAGGPSVRSSGIGYSSLRRASGARLMTNDQELMTNNQTVTGVGVEPTLGRFSTCRLYQLAYPVVRARCEPIAGPGLEPGCRAYQTQPRARAPALAEFHVPQIPSQQLWNSGTLELETPDYSCGPGS
jgi:hypothetical protein